jgi:uncharacterized protein (TIGR00369 family)
MADISAGTLQELSKTFTELPFNRMLGLRMGEIHPECVTMSFDMKPELIGNYFYGILHGGVISSVLDMAGGVAIMIAAVQKRQGQTLEELAAILGKASTINLHIDYIRPGKGETFTAKAYLVQSGNKISFARMELFNEKSLLIANGTGTYLVG